MSISRLAKQTYKLLTWPERSLRDLLRQWLSPSVSTSHFGWREAIVYSHAIDIWQRYSILAEVVKRSTGRMESILDIGAGGDGISSFLPKGQYSICLLDRDESRLAAARLRPAVNRVLADACALPFPDSSFDFVVSADNLEHIPPDLRPAYYTECQRVTRGRLLLHVPVTDGEGCFRGDFFDQKFQNLHRLFFRREEPNVAEHIENGLPTLEELSRVFPGASFSGRTNGRVWLRYMLLERVPYLRLLTGTLYLLFQKHWDHTPHYYACFLSWAKPSPGTSARPEGKEVSLQERGPTPGEGWNAAANPLRLCAKG